MSPISIPAPLLNERDLLKRKESLGPVIVPVKVELELHSRTLKPETYPFPRKVIGEIHASSPTVRAAAAGEGDDVSVGKVGCPC